MIYEFEPLSKQDQELMLKAPAFIAVLIAGADNDIDPQEVHRAVELVNVKTFSEKQDLQTYYNEVEKTIERDINSIIDALPKSADERNPIISAELAKLNPALSKIKAKFAHDLYNSWKGYAGSVARSWGGIMGINSVNSHEKEWVNLPMLNEPAQAQ
jgi:hypothetical protein